MTIKSHHNVDDLPERMNMKLALRAVTSTDGMTAGYYHFDYDFLSRTATRIINEVRGNQPRSL